MYMQNRIGLIMAPLLDAIYNLKCIQACVNPHNAWQITNVKIKHKIYT